MSKKSMKDRPALVYADAEGNISDWPALEMAGAGAGEWIRPHFSELIELPEGSELFLLPERLPVGYNGSQRRFETLAADPFDPAKSVCAVAAFISPAYTHLLSPAYRTKEGAPILPLFAYTSVGWANGGFVVPAVRIDSDRRQDFCNFDLKLIERNARKRMRAESKNRLLQHLGKCALTYGCPAAKNLFMNRWEAPLPTSPECNARCIGCISRQEGTGLSATQERIGFVPSPEEISGVAIPHLQKAPRAVVSFGQGCEGEPLLQAQTLEASIRMIRKATGKGTINLNTNGSIPEAVEKLCRAGLQSIRVSMNSARPQYYEKYFRPKGFSFDEARRSLSVVKANGGFASINYFVLPGFTDQKSEWLSLKKLISETRLDLIQMRNLNIDPEWYLDILKPDLREKKLGAGRLIAMIREEFPSLRLGYFNPSVE
ncbi:MAG: radical SAM protein [Syntrophobacteraceae bacterium]|nr:radical SAM protein [Syntrophobacteraceae bacterium]